jgi:XTP/dITP diphosphohydrolase
VCVAALATPDGAVVTARGECAGEIAETPRGSGGFGYDPVFMPSGEGAAMAELPEARKNQISHRAVAFSRAARCDRSRARNRADAIRADPPRGVGLERG